MVIIINVGKRASRCVIHGIVSGGSVDARLVDTRQVASDAHKLHTTNAEHVGNVVVRHRHFQIDWIIQSLRVSGDAQTIVGRRVPKDGAAAEGEKR